MRARSLLILSTATTLAFAASAAFALDRPIFAQANGSGACQAALPNYEGQIRKRPLAIQNEGTADAFMTCSPVSLQGNALHGSGHGLVLVNVTAANLDVTCTGVSGPDSGANYMPKTATVPAGGSASINWLGMDGVDALNIHTMNMSCHIPPGIGIRTVYTKQVVDVGN